MAQAAPDQRAAFENAMSRLDGLVANRLTDGPAIAQAAQAVERIADSLTAKFVAQDFDAAWTQAMLQALNAGIQRIADSGVNAAEQATMTLDSLSASLGRTGKQQAVTALYTYLEHPSTYRPSEFVAKFKAAAE